MAQEGKGYLLGPSLHAQIKETIARVGGTPVGSGAGRIPTDLSGDVAPFQHVLSKTTTAWSKGSSASLSLYSGDPGSEQATSDVTVTAWNYVVNLPGDLWVVLARVNGTFYLASFDYTGLSNYASSSQQILAHNASGELVWLNTTSCT